MTIIKVVYTLVSGKEVTQKFEGDVSINQVRRAVASDLEYEGFLIVSEEETEASRTKEFIKTDKIESYKITELK